MGGQLQDGSLYTSWSEAGRPSLNSAEPEEARQGPGGWSRQRFLAKKGMSPAILGEWHKPWMEQLDNWTTTIPEQL